MDTRQTAKSKEIGEILAELAGRMRDVEQRTDPVTLHMYNVIVSSDDAYTFSEEVVQRVRGDGVSAREMHQHMTTAMLNRLRQKKERVDELLVLRDNVDRVNTLREEVACLRCTCERHEEQRLKSSRKKKRCC